MAGFPTRLVRSDLGPEYQNTMPVRDPSRQIGATITNLSFRQLTGVNMTADLAWLIIDIDALNVTSHAECWNIEGATSGEYAPPVISDEGGGVYHITYNPEYQDETGEYIPVNFRGALAQVQEPHFGRPQLWAGRIAANVIRLRVSGFTGGERVLVIIK